MKTGKRITAALIRAGPDPGPMLCTGGHDMAGGGQEDALRAPSKDLGQGGHQPLVAAKGLWRTVQCQKTNFQQSVPLFGGEKIMDKEKGVIKDDKGCSIVCERCGRCCGELLEAEATVNDIATWIAARRFDILKWVDPIIGPSLEVVAFDIWIDPKTHDDVKKCPWLRKRKGSNVHECAIYDVRPAACRDWPADVAEGLKLGCPACEEKTSGGAGEGEVVKPRRDED